MIPFLIQSYFLSKHFLYRWKKTKGIILQISYSPKDKMYGKILLKQVKIKYYSILLVNKDFQAITEWIVYTQFLGKW